MNKLNENNEVENEEDADLSIGMRALNYTNLVDRYFDKYYIDKGKPTEQYVFIHSRSCFIHFKASSSSSTTTTTTSADDDEL